MAISKEQLTVEVVLDSSGAIKGIKDLQGQFVEFDKVLKTSSSTTKTANDNTSKLSQSLGTVSSALSKAALPLLAVQTAVSAVTQVFGVLSSTLGSFVNDYAAAEQAQTLLSQAIENSSGRITNSATAWGEYLDQLQEVKAVDADVLRGLVAQAVQMGFSEQQIKSLVEASIGLSKVTGDSLDGSFQKLIGTTRGMARGLSAMVPELQNLTQEQLRSGDAFEIVANKYKNAADGAGSYSYAVKQAGLAAGELSEDIGRAITEVFNLKGALDTATSVINGVRAALAGIDFASLGRNFAELVSNAGPVLVFITGLTAALTGLSPVILGVVSPIVLLTAKLLLIVGAVTAVVTVIEMLATNFGIVENAIAIAANGIALAVISMVRNVSEDLGKLFSLFGEDNPMAKAFNQITTGLQKSVENLKTNISKNTSEIKATFDKTFTADLFKQAGNAIDSFRGKSDATTTSLTKLGQTGARTKVIDEKALEKADAALKEIIKQTDALNLATRTSGADQITQLQEKGKEQLRLIDLKEKELAQQGLLNDKLKDALDDQRVAVVVNTQKSIETEKQNQLLEQQKKINSELTSIVNSTKSAQEQIRMSNLGTFDVIKAQSATELEKITALEKQLELAGGLTAEKQAEIEATKQGIKEIESARTGQAIMSGVTSALSAAQGGADALVGNLINQVGAAFGPEGQMIAGVVNLLRKGKDFTKQLGQDLIGIIADLPKMLTEGAIGLIEGLVDGLMKLLGDPKAIMQFINSIVTAVPKIISALVAGLPQIAIAMSKPSFWIAVIKGFVVAFIDGQKEMIKSLIEGFKSIGSGLVEVFEDAISVFSEIGDKLLEGFEIAWNWLSGMFTSIGDIVWDGISSAFAGIGNFFSEIFKFDGGGKGAVEDFLGFDFPWIAFAQGGIVPGSPKVLGDSASNDIVPALLSPGEAVIPRSMMKDEGVASFVGALFSGKKLQRHFLGIPGTEAIPFGDKEVNAVTDAIAEGVSAAGEWIGDTFVPDNIKKLWDSLKKFVSNIDLKRLITDPLGMITDSIKGSLDFLQGPFRKMMSFNVGGLVPGIGNTDTVPAMLTPGEFVINKSAVQSLGSGLLSQLNNGRMPMSDSAQIFNINLNIETKEALDEGFIRQRLMPALKAELKASSLRGDFILSAKGVRG